MCTKRAAGLFSDSDCRIVRSLKDEIQLCFWCLSVADNLFGMIEMDREKGIECFCKFGSCVSNVNHTFPMFIQLGVSWTHGLLLWHNIVTRFVQHFGYEIIIWFGLYYDVSCSKTVGPFSQRHLRNLNNRQLWAYICMMGIIVYRLNECGQSKSYY